MKHINNFVRIILIALCLVTVISLASCTADMENGNNTELGDRFLTELLNDDKNEAYELLKHSVNKEEFNNYWTNIRPVAYGATTYEMEQIGWKTNISNGITTRVSAFQVYFDNGETILLRVTTREDIEGIAGIYFSDVTAFLDQTDGFVSAGSIILIVVSLLSIAFVIWMFVDCLRRKIKRKVLWAILIFCGIRLTFTIGEQLGLNFFVGIVLQMNSIAADPSIKSVVAKFILPVGAILYFFLRKRLTIAPPVDTANDGENGENNESDETADTKENES